MDVRHRRRKALQCFYFNKSVIRAFTQKARALGFRVHLCRRVFNLPVYNFSVQSLIAVQQSRQYPVPFPVPLLNKKGRYVEKHKLEGICLSELDAALESWVLVWTTSPERTETCALVSIILSNDYYTQGTVPLLQKGVGEGTR